MRNLGLAIVGIIVAVSAYLLLWPTPIEPVAWSPTPSRGYDGPFSVNKALVDPELITLGGFHGPEDIAAKEEGGTLALYMSTQDGKILRLDPHTKEISTFADTGGVPLGIEFDRVGNLIVGDAYRGLLSISVDGTVSTLTNEVGGSPILYADDLDFGSNGVIYFSDASVKFGAQAAGSTLAGSVQEILEHGRTGRLLAFDPATGKTSVVATGFSFPNGVATAPDGQSVLMAETGEYRIVRVYISGSRKGEHEDVVTGLPGFPDNINRGPILEDGTPTFLAGLAGPRLPVIDDLAGNPLARKIVSRLPDFMKPAPVPYSFVFQFTDDGDIIRTWQDPQGAYPVTTGAIAPGDGYLYVTSLEAGNLARLPYP